MRRVWHVAQAREADAWERMGAASAPYVERRGAFLEAWLRFWAPQARRVLEIGGAGLPAVGYGHAVDPLLKHYRRIFPEDTSGVQARGEELPYPDGHFDAVFLLNVLDHTEDPDRVLREAARVLRKNGRVLLSCDTYAPAWLWLRRARVALLGKRNNDLLHPHHFTVASLTRLCARHFDVLEICNRHLDPLGREGVSAATPYPLGGLRTRTKRAGRLYVAAARRASSD